MSYRFAEDVEGRCRLKYGKERRSIKCVILKGYPSSIPLNPLSSFFERSLKSGRGRAELRAPGSRNGGGWDNADSY